MNAPDRAEANEAQRRTYAKHRDAILARRRAAVRERYARNPEYRQRELARQRRARTEARLLREWGMNNNETTKDATSGQPEQTDHYAYAPHRTPTPAATLAPMKKADAQKYAVKSLTQDDNLAERARATARDFTQEEFEQWAKGAVAGRGMTVADRKKVDWVAVRESIIATGNIFYTTPSDDSHITDEMVNLVVEILRGWYPEGRVNWEDVWDRADGRVLDDGTRLDLGGDLTSPALETLRRRAMRNR